MIEAMAILAITLISGMIIIGARMNSRGVWRSAAEERRHWEEVIAAHEAKLRLAREKNWDAVMVGLVEERLAEARRRLALVTRAAPAASRQNPRN